MTREIEVGFSPCPNDTFMFHAWVDGIVGGDLRPRPWLADIEQLNRRALGDDPLPVTKISAAVLGRVADRYRIATAGAALGRGCGPLVVTRESADAPASLDELRGKRIAIPGAATTAAMLLRAFGPDDVECVEHRFERIMPAVARGGCDAGVIIHESRFTYRGHGLRAIADLGEVWERDTGLPLPLGVIAVRRDVLDAHFVRDAIRASVEYAFADRDASAGYVRAHAQELDPEVCAQHIALYVNEFSADVGDEGRRAVEELLRRGIGASPSLAWIGG